MKATKVEVRRLAAGVCGGLIEHTVLQCKGGKLVVQIPWNRHQGVILKLWSKRGFKELIRRATRTGTWYRELRVLKHLHRHGVRVPQVYGYARLGRSEGSYTYAMVQEDLGDMGKAVDYLKRLIREDPRQAEQFEAGVIDLTARILELNVVDPDHSMVNIVAVATGEPARIDFELARRVLTPRQTPALLGEMIGRLVGSYTFAVQPDVTRVTDFAQRLQNRLGLPASILRRAEEKVQTMMDIQRSTVGIDTRLELNW